MSALTAPATGVDLRTYIEPETISASARWRWVVVVADEFRYGPWGTKAEAAEGQRIETAAAFGLGLPGADHADVYRG